MAYLEIETRDGVQHIALDRDQLSVGRLAYNDVVLPFAHISRHHPELPRIKGQCGTTALHSPTGPPLAPGRVSEHAWPAGAQILFAPGLPLRFPAGVVPPRAPEAPPPVPPGAVQPTRAPPRPAKAPYAPPAARSPYAD